MSTVATEDEAPGGAPLSASAPVPPDRLVAAFSRAYGHFSVLLDASFNVLWGSETLTPVFGWTDVVGRNIVELIHPDDLDLVLGGIVYHSEHAEEYRQFADTWRPDVTTMRVAHADGSWVRCDVSLFNHLADPDIGALLATGRISDDRTDMALAIDLLGSGAGPCEVLPVLARLVDNTIDGVRSQVMWWDETTDWLVAAPGCEELPSPPASLIASVLRSGEIESSIELDLVPYPGVDTDFKAVWVLPIVAPGRDLVVGCLVVWSRLRLPLVTGPQQPIHQAVRLASLAIVDHHAKSALRWEASHDPLTALRNRAGFHTEVASIDVGCALFYVDLDDFKIINDRLGHQAGDAVLVEVARRIRNVVRDHDTVGRLGGDEFAVLCPGLLDAEVATDIAGRLIESVSRPISVGGRPVAV
ncbi:MAG TPA: GGDEF domain-containing protein, partial [Microthrixaceae bacterium]|nr:GGDEF domain-containing protein [Microthrixaceae bacterium]